MPSVHLALYGGELGQYGGDGPRQLVVALQRLPPSAGLSRQRLKQRASAGSGPKP